MITIFFNSFKVKVFHMADLFGASLSINIFVILYGLSKLMTNGYIYYGEYRNLIHQGYLLQCGLLFLYFLVGRCVCQIKSKLFSISR